MSLFRLIVLVCPSLQDYLQVY